MSRVLEQIDKVLEPTDMDDTPVGIDMEQASFTYYQRLKFWIEPLQSKEKMQGSIKEEAEIR